MKCLVTGGAGFIGSHVCDGLIEAGHEVRAIDSLVEQVHSGGKVPEYLNPKVEFIKGDVTDKDALLQALEGAEWVFHLAGAVGVGQSMYEIARYTRDNSYGTALLLDLIVNNKNSVKKIMVAASKSSYGEGSYDCGKCGLVRPPLRGEAQLSKKDWEPRCPACGGELKMVPTSEEAEQKATSIYAINKKNQEELVLCVGRAYGIPAVALRYFNAYGPRQSLSNPYNGVAAIFMSRIKNGKAPVIFEDGGQTVDVVSVHDIKRATILAMERPQVDYHSINIGCGTALSIKGIAETIAKVYGSDIKPEITGQYRTGDVRHCYADTSRAEKLLAWQPQVTFEQGMRELVEWGKQAEAVDNLDGAMQVLKRKGLSRQG